MNNRNLILVILAIVLVGVVAFAIGARYQWRQMSYNYNTTPSNQNLYNGRMMWGRGKTGMMGRGYGYGRGLLRGTVANINGNNLTLTLANGQQYTVSLSDQAQVTKSVTAAKNDLKNGANVVVYGNGASVMILP